MNKKLLDFIEFDSGMITRDFIKYIVELYGYMISSAYSYLNLNKCSTKKLIDGRNRVLSKIKVLDLNNNNSGIEAINIILEEFEEWEDIYKLFLQIKEDYEFVCRFINSSDIKYLIMDSKKDTLETIFSLDYDKRKIVENIKQRVVFILRMYFNRVSSMKDFRIRLLDLTEQKSKFEEQINLLKKDIRNLRKEWVKNKETITRKDTEISILKWQKLQLEKQISSLNDEMQQLKNQDKKVEDPNPIQNNDDGQLEIAMEQAIEYQTIAEKNAKKLESVIKEKDLLAQQLELLKNQLNSSTQLDTFIFKCEQFPNDCNTSDMLKYITIKDCPFLYKKEIVDIVINFLEEFLWNVSKWASSGMNWNEWVGWWSYANNYVNPFVNYIKDKWRTTNTQDFLEFIFNIDLKSLTKDVVDPNYGDKKSRFFSSVYEQFKDDDFMNIFEALSYISKKLENIKRGNLDLSTLTSNIDNFLEWKKTVLERKFREIFLKVINQKYL